LRITGIIWLEDILTKLQDKHGVEPEEVREILASQPWFRFVEKGHRRGEKVYAAFGKTQAGRYLIVFFVYKKEKRALILSARDMTPTERKTYARR